jgi:hypothetical protein
VIDDGVSPEAERALRAVASGWTSVGGKGPRESLRLAFEAASARPANEWVYLLEDDYAHAPDWRAHFADLVEGRERYLGPHAGRDLFVHLPDYIDRYRPVAWAPGGLDDRYHLFIGAAIHWRQVFNTTHSFLARAGVLAKHERLWRELDLRDGEWSREVYRREDTLCLSPIPGLAHHLEVQAPPTPGRDWAALARAYARKGRLPRALLRAP